MRIRNLIIIIAMLLMLCSWEYQSPIREPFEDYKEVENPYAAPNRAPINWDDLPYDDPNFGWLYRQLWYLYHSGSTETPPWEKTVPVGDGICLLLTAVGVYIVHKHRNLRFKTTNTEQ